MATTYVSNADRIPGFVGADPGEKNRGETEARVRPPGAVGQNGILRAA
jgi:hypothetical protein